MDVVKCLFEFCKAKSSSQTNDNGNLFLMISKEARAFNR